MSYNRYAIENPYLTSHELCISLYFLAVLNCITRIELFAIIVNVHF